MANTIKIRRSATASAVPTTTQLALGELAMNTYDGKLFMKKSVSGVESIVDITAGGSGNAQITVSDTAPSSPTNGQLWWRSSEGQLYIYYTDGTSNQWVIANAFAGGVGYLPTAGGTLSGSLNLSSGTLQVGGKQAVNGPAFHAYLNAPQTNNGTIQKVNFNAELFDTDNCFDSTTNYRFTPNVEGYYQFNGMVVNGGQIAIFCEIYKNGSAVIYGNRTDFTSSAYGLSYASVVNGLLYMNGSTDYVELYAQTVNGAAFQGNTSGALVSRFSGYMARGA